MSVSTTDHRANFSRERRRTAVRYLRAEVPLKKPFSDGALLMLTVCLLICDDAGFVSQPATVSAMNDPSVVSAAREVIRKAGL